MQAQFLRIAGELGWDLDTQIDKLETFIEASGRQAELDAFFAGRHFAGVARRDMLLAFIEQGSNSGQFTNFLLRHFRPALAAPAKPAAEASPEAGAAAETVTTPAAPVSRGFLGWLRRRRQHAAAG